MITMKEKEPDEITGCVKKQSIANLYFKNLGEMAALNALSRTIREDHALKEELETIGEYNKFKHSMTPLQQEILRKHLGDPE